MVLLARALSLTTTTTKLADPRMEMYSALLSEGII
jgi:hypothetical protein